MLQRKIYENESELDHIKVVLKGEKRINHLLKEKNKSMEEDLGLLMGDKANAVKKHRQLNDI